MRSRVVARVAGSALVVAGGRLVVEAPGAAAWDVALACAASGIGIILIGVRVASLPGLPEGRPPLFETGVLDDGARAILTLRTAGDGADRPDPCEVVVRKVPGEWFAYIDATAARARVRASPPGSIEVVFPDDFVGYDEPSEGWHEVTWLQPRTDSSSNVRLEPVAVDRFKYEGGGRLARYATDPRRSRTPRD